MVKTEITKLSEIDVNSVTVLPSTPPWLRDSTSGEFKILGLFRW